jgi:hypothetical protein
MSCPTSRCLSTPEPALNAPGVARCRWCRWASMRSLARRMSRVTPWTTAAAVSTCRRRAASSTAAVSSSSAAAFSCSCCASMYQTSARSRGWRSELALHRRPALCVPTSRDPERTRLHPSSPAVGVRSVLVAVRNYRGPRALVDGRPYQARSPRRHCWQRRTRARQGPAWASPMCPSGDGTLRQTCRSACRRSVRWPWPARCARFGHSVYFSCHLLGVSAHRRRRSRSGLMVRD